MDREEQRVSDVELQAKAVIAAALIQSKAIVISVPGDALKNWMADANILKLQHMTQLIYDAVKSPRR